MTPNLLRHVCRLLAARPDAEPCRIVLGMPVEWGKVERRERERYVEAVVRLWRRRKEVRKRK